jgi:hypothetical protein
VNGKLYKQVLAPGGVPKEEEKAVTTVLNSPYSIPLYELRWAIQFESKGTSQTGNVVVLVDHWSLWGACVAPHSSEATVPMTGYRLTSWSSRSDL